LRQFAKNSLIKIENPCKIRGFKKYIVGAARFELATSWSQTRRDDRATLRPELFHRVAKVRVKVQLKKQGG
jgi:hypothetical protein